MALDDQVRDAICIFYLVLRGLDTIEDDMSVPLDIKVPELAAFYEKLEQPGVPFTAGYLVCGTYCASFRLVHHPPAFLPSFRHLNNKAKNIQK